MQTLYFCLADGMADCLPNSQEYHACSDAAEMREVIDSAIAEFTESEGATPHLHMIPAHVWQMLAERGASSLNWRLCVAREGDRVLDIIGMTESEYERESAE